MIISVCRVIRLNIREAFLVTMVFPFHSEGESGSQFHKCANLRFFKQSVERETPAKLLTLLVFVNFSFMTFYFFYAEHLNALSIGLLNWLKQIFKWRFSEMFLF